MTDDSHPRYLRGLQARIQRLSDENECLRNWPGGRTAEVDRADPDGELRKQMVAALERTNKLAERMQAEMAKPRVWVRPEGLQSGVAMRPADEAFEAAAYGEQRRRIHNEQVARSGGGEVKSNCRTLMLEAPQESAAFKAPAPTPKLTMYCQGDYLD